MNSIKKYFNKITANKLAMRILWIVCLILFLFSLSQYSKYKPARFNYNRGVKQFREGNYERAEERFHNALMYKHTKKHECKIRINRALSLVTPITPDSVNADNLEEKITVLEEARDFLTENDCAHADDSQGHNRKAQRLKEEIDAYIEQLKEQNKQPEEEDKKEDEKKSEEEKKKEEEEKKRKEEEAKRQKEEEKKLEEKFMQVEQEGMKERNENLELYKAYEMNDIYYSGKSW